MKKQTLFTDDAWDYIKVYGFGDYNKGYEAIKAEIIESRELDEEEAAALTEEDVYDWVNDQISFDWECLMDNLEYSKSNAPCVLTGRLGLWNGRPEIEAMEFDDIKSAISKICNVRFSYNLEIEKNEDGYLDISQSHHDGTNHFEIHLLNNRNRGEDSDLSNPHFHKKMPEYLW